MRNLTVFSLMTLFCSMSMVAYGAPVGVGSYAELGAMMNKSSSSADRSVPKVEKTVRMCGETIVSFDGNQAPADDEFLYDTQTAYDSIKNRSDGGTVNGTIFECDDDHCAGGPVQNMGPNHIFMGNLIPYAAQYRCSTGFADKWIQQYEMCQYRGTYISENNWYVDNESKKILLNKSDCLQFGLDIEPRATEFNAKCEKINDTLQMKCYPINLPTKSQEELDCEAAAGSGAVWKNGKCECIGNKTWDPKKKTCVATVTPTPKPTPKLTPKPVTPALTPLTPVIPGKFQCSEDMIRILMEYKITYSSDLKITFLVDKLIDYCLKDLDPQEAEVIRMFTELNILIKQYEDAAAKGRQQAYTEKTTMIRNISSNIEKMDFGDITVWKNAEGKFNTSRLVSDSVAGVVLGTAGGLITSNVVKKNQVENGFEDISCTVGGQVVASWGDEFNVGIR